MSLVSPCVSPFMVLPPVTRKSKGSPDSKIPKMCAERMTHHHYENRISPTNRTKVYYIIVTL